MRLHHQILYMMLILQPLCASERFSWCAYCIARELVCKRYCTLFHEYFMQGHHTSQQHVRTRLRAYTRAGTRTHAAMLKVHKHAMCCCLPLCSFDSNNIGSEGAAALAVALPHWAALRFISYVPCLRASISALQECV